MPDIDLIGQGWKFPIKVNAKGGLDWSSGPERVQQAIWLVLSTSLGERIMRPEFGAGAQDYVFQSNSSVTRSTLANAVKKALVKWEPRIDVQSIRVDPAPDSDSKVLISIDYKIRTVNELFNLVYPLYLAEGVS